jgi:hypothetical protein
MQNSYDTNFDAFNVVTSATVHIFDGDVLLVRHFCSNIFVAQVVLFPRIKTTEKYRTRDF